MRHFTIAITISVLMVLTGCRSQKIAPEAVVSTASDAELYDLLANGYAAYSDAYIPVTLSLESPVNFSASGRATIVRDKEIHISFRFLGMEVAVLYVDTEDVYIVDKYHKLYYTDKLSNVLGDVPLTVGNMQDLLLGRAFIPGGTTITAADMHDFKLAGTPAMMSMAPARQIKDAKWHYEVSRTEPPQLSALVVDLPSGTEIKCGYGASADGDTGRYASSMRITAPIKGKTAAAQLTWSDRDAKWNTGRSVNFTAPDKSYRRISSLQELMQAF